jgi:hypothetical protein
LRKFLGMLLPGGGFTWLLSVPMQGWSVWMG